MKIDLEMTYGEFSWVCLMTTRCNNVGYEVDRVYRNESNKIAISLMPIVFGEKKEVDINDDY